jgi:hypothetical protein
VFEEKNKTDQIWVSQKTINDAYVKFGAFCCVIFTTVAIPLLGSLVISP